ncbi:MAG: hypothetical protein V1898_03180 [Patescibacteria group bacterium]
MDFGLTFQDIMQEYGTNPFSVFIFLMKHGGLVIIFPFFVKGCIDGWLEYIQERTKHSRKFVLMSVNVPKDNEQSMKAIEQIYAHIYGTYDTPNFVEKWWDGWTMEVFSLEIISDGGYIKFYLRCVDYHQDIVEAAIYAQYPDAEIYEIPPEDDYRKKLTVKKLDNKEIKLYGAELNLEADDIFCIRHWRGWEHSLLGKFIDPLSAILEIMSRLRPGENLWYQFLIQPVDLKPLSERCQKEINKLTGDIKSQGSSIFDKLIEFPLNFLAYLAQEIIGTGTTDSSSQSKAQDPKRIFLVEYEREAVSEIDMKRSRWPFLSKIRFIYWSKPEVYQEVKGRRGFTGALRQYKFLNAFKEGRWTKVSLSDVYWFDKYFFPFKDIRQYWRRRRLIWNYRAMNMDRGEHHGFHLNAEELASLYHFPQIDVRAPFVQKAESRRVEPPTSLVFESQAGEMPPTVNMDNDSLPVNENENMPSLVPHPNDSPKPATIIVNLTPEQVAYHEQLMQQEARYRNKNQNFEPQISQAPEVVFQEIPEETENDDDLPNNIPFV